MIFHFISPNMTTGPTQKSLFLTYDSYLQVLCVGGPSFPRVREIIYEIQFDNISKFAQFCTFSSIIPNSYLIHIILSKSTSNRTITDGLHEFGKGSLNKREVGKFKVGISEENFQFRPIVLKRKLSNFELQLKTFQLFDFYNCPFQLATSMLVTDVEDKMCWRQF